MSMLFRFCPKLGFYKLVISTCDVISVKPTNLKIQVNNLNCDSGGNLLKCA